MNEGEPTNKKPVPAAWALLFANFSHCRTRNEDSADRIGRKNSMKVLRQESEAKGKQEETECFDRSDRVLLAEPNNSLKNDPECI
jgi:hypothetical protein